MNLPYTAPLASSKKWCRAFLPLTTYALAADHVQVVGHDDIAPDL